jgi:hypothetical protein
MSDLAESNPSKRPPLNLRLRAEASHWDHDDQVANLLLEAASELERLATAMQEADQWAMNTPPEVIEQMERESG